MASCSQSEETRSIEPLNDGFYERGDMLDINSNVVRFGNNTSLRAFTMLKDEEQLFSKVRSYMIITVKGEVYTIGRCDRGDFCSIPSIKAGTVALKISRFDVTIKAVEKSSVVVISFPNSHNYDFNESGVSFNDRTFESGVFTYNMDMCSNPITKDVMARVFPPNSSLAHADIHVYLANHEPSLYFPNGKPAGSIWITKHEEPHEFTMSQKTSKGMLQVVIPVAKMETPKDNPEDPQLVPVNWLYELAKASTPHIPFYKGKGAEITVNSLKPDETIEWETHDEDQIIMVVSNVLGVGIESETTKKWQTVELKNGESVVIPAGWRHRLVNQRQLDVKFISIYVDVGRAKSDAPKK
jgi:mannose-6-phosphate isomerase-like protein (cupin superfamily)